MEVRKPHIKSIPYDEFKDNASLEKIVDELHEGGVNVVVDSLDQVIDQKYAQNAAPILSWWQRLCQSIKFIMLGAMIAVAVYYGRKLTRNICL